MPFFVSNMVIKTALQRRHILMREISSLTRPKMGTKWCSHIENMSISFTITISSWSSSKIASFRTSARRYKNKSRRSGRSPSGERYDIMKSLYFTPCALPVVALCHFSQLISLFKHIPFNLLRMHCLFLWGFLISWLPISGKVSVETWQTRGEASGSC